MRLASVPAVALALAACAPEVTEPCAETDQPALRIIVLSYGGGNLCKAQVIATSVDTPTFSEELLPVDCEYAGVIERPGEYKVSITAHGHFPKTIYPTAKVDDCGHVATHDTTVVLLPDAAQIP